MAWNALEKAVERVTDDVTEKPPNGKTVKLVIGLLGVIVTLMLAGVSLLLTHTGRLATIETKVGTIESDLKDPATFPYFTHDAGALRARMEDHLNNESEDHMARSEKDDTYLLRREFDIWAKQFDEHLDSIERKLGGN